MSPKLPAIDSFVSEADKATPLSLSKFDLSFLNLDRSRSPFLSLKLSLSLLDGGSDGDRRRPCGSDLGPVVLLRCVRPRIVGEHRAIIPSERGEISGAVGPVPGSWSEGGARGCQWRRESGEF